MMKVLAGMKICARPLRVQRENGAAPSPGQREISGGSRRRPSRRPQAQGGTRESPADHALPLALASMGRTARDGTHRPRAPRQA